MVFVLDACAMIAYLRNEPGSERVAQLLLSDKDRCVAHAINLCEVFYDFYRAGGEAEAKAAIADLSRVGIMENTELGLAFWQAAGAVKAVHRRVSLADCFAIALANSLGATILTSDHHEFDPLAVAGTCQVEFIR